MRKTWIAVLMVMAGFYFSGASLAQEVKAMKPGMEHGIMKDKMCGHMMKCGMMEKSVVATTDGGVVVVIGNTIIKYDKNLNVVKEAQIKCDTAAMPMPMMGMNKDCPMMKGDKIDLDPAPIVKP